MQTIPLDRVDLRLLHALQIEPRASWSDLAPVVGSDVATLSRRWRRLSNDGIAWITGIVEGRQGALVEIECSPGALNDTAVALADDPNVLVLDLTSGTRDLLATIYVKDQQELADYALGRLSKLPGVRAARTHLVTDRLVDGGTWRLRELSPSEIARIPAPAPPRPRAARHVAPELREIVELELGRNGRATATEIGDAHGISSQRIGDAIATLRHSGALNVRTDIARAASGWPVYAWYFMEVPASTIEAARRSIASVPEVRLAVTCSSRYNLIMAVWLRNLSDVNRFELALESAMPGARIADRSVVMSIRKHLGRILSPDTRATGQYRGL